MVFIGLLLLVESVSQIAFWMKKGHPFWQDQPSFSQQIFEPAPYLIGRLKASVDVLYEDEVYGNKRFRTTEIHTRWTGADLKNDSLITIAVLGGSTTFCTGLSDEDTWPAILQKKLGDQYQVINYGVPGYSTAENIIQMSMLVPERKPDIVIFYLGWNDIKSYHVENLGAEYRAHGFSQYHNLDLPVTFHQTRMDAAKKIFASIYIFGSLKARFRNAETPPTPVKEPDPFVDHIYQRNLKTLKNLTHQIGANAIFIPQILNNKNFEDEREFKEWTPHIKANSMPELMARFNDFLPPLCKGDQEDCLVLERMEDLSWKSDDFVDDGHFSKKGSEKFVDQLMISIQ